MALPTIIVDDSGSDTAASGAGPATALTGTAASTNGAGTVVTLDGSPDLSGVATDGSHVVYLQDATAGNRNFGKITAKDDGADTVTVNTAFGASLSGLTWAIGGKRASIGDTNSRKLLRNNSSTGDMEPGWTLEFEDGHVETVTSSIEIELAGNTTDGAIFIRGESGAATMPRLDFNTNTEGFEYYACDAVTTEDLHLKNTNATKTASYGVRGQSSACERLCFHRLKLEAWYIGVYTWFMNLDYSATFIGLEIWDCDSHGFWGDANSNAPLYSYIHDNGGDGIHLGNTEYKMEIVGNIIANNTGDGINIGNLDKVLCVGNTIDNNDGDGIDHSSTTSRSCTFINNIISNNTGTGYRASSQAESNLGHCYFNNNTYNNGSRLTNFTETSLWVGDPQVDPGYTNAAGGDYSVGTNLKEEGYPESNFLGSSSRSYVEIGAVQRQEPAGGSGSIFIPRPRSGALIGR